MFKVLCSLSMCPRRCHVPSPVLLVHVPPQVRARSEGFLAALETRWQEERGVMMPSIADILLEHTR